MRPTDARPADDAPPDAPAAGSEAAGRGAGRHGDVLAAAAGCVALAAVVFYAVTIARFALDVPVEDDVEFLRFLLGDDGTGWLALHNEHRPLTARLIFTAVAGVLGHLDHRAVMAVGNASLLGIAAILVRWLPRGERADRIFAAAPIFVLLFTLQPWQAATWATGAAQHYPMLLCALASIECLARPTPARVAAGAGLATLAFLDLGAGVFAFATGLALLLHARRPMLALAFAAWALPCVALYLVGYARPEHHPSTLAALASPVEAFDYLCTLVGGGISFDDARVGWLARFAGWGLLLAFAVIAAGRRWREDPRVLAAMAFVLLSLAAVTVTRFGFGLDQAFDSRYRIYSLTLIALAYVAMLDAHGLAASRNRTALALLAAIALSAASAPRALDSMAEHRRFYAGNARAFGLGEAPIPGPASYSSVVRRALERGLWRFPCAAVDAQPGGDNPWCDTGAPPGR